MIENAWIKYLDGDNDSLSEVYLISFEKMKAYGLKIGFDQKTCEDAIQDIFIKICCNREKLTHVKRIEFYLLNSLKNRLFDYHQEERRRRVIDKDEVFQKYEDSVIESIILTERELHMKREVERFMQSISPKQRRILHYYYQLNMSADEIATIFDITPDAVRRSISRSIKKIQSAHPEMILS